MLPHTTQIANSGHTLWQLYHTWAIRSLRKHAGEVMPRHSWHDPNVSPKVTTLPFFCTDDLIPWVQGADLDFADRSPSGAVTFVTFQHLSVWPPVDFNTDPWKWYFCPSMLFSLCLSHPTCARSPVLAHRCGQLHLLWRARCRSTLLSPLCGRSRCSSSSSRPLKRNDLWSSKWDMILQHTWSTFCMEHVEICCDSYPRCTILRFG